MKEPYSDNEDIAAINLMKNSTLSMFGPRPPQPQITCIDLSYYDISPSSRAKAAILLRNKVQRNKVQRNKVKNPNIYLK